MLIFMTIPRKCRALLSLPLAMVCALPLALQSADKAAVKAAMENLWSLQPIEQPAVPGNESNAIDAFVKEKLQERGLTPSSPADRATLIRRLSFDLLGLPPSPADVDAFVNDPSPQAYSALVDRLLASPHYGERWGRHWLDVARFAESDGFEYDRIRPNAWGYRDYVIRSFNEDKPYDQFMREQIAGDVIEPVTRDGMLATSLLVCGPWDAAGMIQANATQRMIAREDEMEDLVSVVGQTFLGLTVNCARCHDHKSDPIPQQEYYRIKAVFDGVKHGERPVVGTVENKKLQEQRSALDEAHKQAGFRISGIESAAIKRLAEKSATTPKAPGPAAMARWVFDGRELVTIQGEMMGGAKAENGVLRLSKSGGYFETSPISRDIREKTLEAWVSLASLDQRGGAVISLEGGQGAFDAIVFGERQPKRWMPGSENFVRTRDQELPEETSAPGTFVHVAITYRADNSIQMYRNGMPLGKAYTPDSPLRTYAAGEARVLLGLRHHGAANGFLTGDIQQAALYDRALSDEEVATSFKAGNNAIPLVEILASLTPEERSARDAAVAESKRIEAERDALTAQMNVVSYVGTRFQPGETKRFLRGEVTSPAEVVTPGALAAVHSLPADFGLSATAPEAERRAKFAAWLTDARHPLPARVMANRLWYFHFGQGLVSTPNDFGVNGARPTHPELLDWLAAKFIENKWSVKALHRLILNSATYKQASASNEKARAVDADNQLLWRFAPRRLEGEVVRDAMLSVSGQLNPQMGGPSYRPFTVTEFNAAFYHLEDRAEPEYNRRTVYRINVNSGKDPLLDAFDCPDPSVKTPRRGVTTTPLQALGLMNNSFVLRQAKFLAERAMQEGKQDLSAAVHAAYRIALGRAPTAEETSLATSAAQSRDLASVCWSLLNSTEFVYAK